MIKFIATNIIQEEFLEEVIELYKRLVKHTRREKGCISYELFQSRENPAKLTMIEEWEAQEYLDNHFKTPHYTEIRPQIVPKLAAKTDMASYTKIV